MSTTKNIRTPLEPGHYYHIFNRGNNRENLFYKPGNYDYFLRKYAHYLEGYVETAAYCLLPNHFHLVVRVRPMEALLPVATAAFKKQWAKVKPEGEEAVHDWLCWSVSERIRLWKMGYSKAINRQEGRIGSLFQKPFRRKRIDDDDYLRHAIAYVHLNPAAHGIWDDFGSYPWSSVGCYEKREEGLNGLIRPEWAVFGGKEACLEYHHQFWRQKRADASLVEDWME
ncbi:MAG: hypothetical protein NXI25_02605 [bacterium]|nr:hypothetical protein [bacterium]